MALAPRLRRIASPPGTGLPSLRRSLRRTISRSTGTGGEEDPDEFRGPGGLTARQLFRAVRESARRDAEARATEGACGVESPSENDVVGCGDRGKTLSVEEMSAAELRSLLRKHSIDCRDCLEKTDLVDRVKRHFPEGWDD